MFHLNKIKTKNLVSMCAFIYLIFLRFIDDSSNDISSEKIELFLLDLSLCFCKAKVDVFGSWIKTDEK